MFGYDIQRFPSFNFSADIVDNVFESISKNIDIPQQWILGISFVSPERIQELNDTYRNKNQVTDVLSFHYFDDFSDLWDSDIAWEIILCEEKILSQAKEHGTPPEKEFYTLLIHSILHIIGYDHEDETEFEDMQKWEQIIWNDVFEK